jgi:hypothetical protein
MKLKSIYVHINNCEIKLILFKKFNLKIHR